MVIKTGRNVKELPSTKENVGAKNHLETNSEWVSWMYEAPKDEWVILETHDNTGDRVLNKIRNRAWRLNKLASPFEFATRSWDDNVVLFGRRR